MADERHEFQLAQDKFLRLLRALELSEIDSQFAADRQRNTATIHPESIPTTQTPHSPPEQVEVWMEARFDRLS